MFDQKLPTWLLCHTAPTGGCRCQHAFEFFGGVPQRLVLDNLKAAIIKAYARDEDPTVQQAYRECAEHYGFLIDPCLPRKPQHKGKVERGGVGYLQQAFVPLLPDGATLSEANRRLRSWLLTEAGLRLDFGLLVEWVETRKPSELKCWLRDHTHSGGFRDQA